MRSRCHLRMVRLEHTRPTFGNALNRADHGCDLRPYPRGVTIFSFSYRAGIFSRASSFFGGKMAIKVGINGFGPIGRNILRASLGESNLEFVAVNDLTDPKTLAHLLKYDSVLGNLTHEVRAEQDSIRVEKRSVRVFSE